MKRYLTAEGLEKLKKELDYLKRIKRKEIAERLKRTASFGDLKENAAYHEAKEAQGFLEGRVSELEDIIRSALVVKKKEAGIIQVGSMVLVSFNGNKEKFQIVGPGEINPKEGKISYQSPLGKALLGKSVGVEVEIENLKNKIQYKILKIE